MLLEAVMHGIPVIMFYPGGDDELTAKTIDLGQKLPHFAEFWGPEGIAICAHAEQLPRACRTMLTAHQSDTVRTALRQHARKFVVLDGPSYADRLAALADELTSQVTEAAA
jgi:hypothetical protein